MKEFEQLINRQVNRIFLILWPPYAEKERSHIDLSIGILFNDNEQVCVIKTDKTDGTTPTFRYQPLPGKVYPSIEFEARLVQWQNSFLEEPFIEEYYDFTGSRLFDDIVNHKIIAIEKMLLNDDHVFGIKLKFNNDYILSTAISDGNTIETSNFRLFDNLSIYQSLGTIKYRSLGS